jgi:hypothetical protein
MEVENNDLLYVKKKPQSYEYLNFSRKIKDGIETGFGRGSYYSND